MLGISVQKPSKDDLNWNDDKIGVNREDFYAQVVIKHSVLKGLQYMSLDEMNDKIAVKNPSKHDLNWNEDKTG